jgi:hypothetical protein
MPLFTLCRSTVLSALTLPTGAVVFLPGYIVGFVEGFMSNIPAASYFPISLRFIFSYFFLVILFYFYASRNRHVPASITGVTFEN